MDITDATSKSPLKEYCHRTHLQLSPHYPLLKQLPPPTSPNENTVSNQYT